MSKIKVVTLFIGLRCRSWFDDNNNNSKEKLCLLVLVLFSGFAETIAASKRQAFIRTTNNFILNILIGSFGIASLRHSFILICIAIHLLW